MSTPTLDTLTQRLDRLERENRRLRIAGGFGALVVIALAVMGRQAAPRPKSIEAEEFILKDRAGKQRAGFGVADLDAFLPRHALT